MLLACSAGVAAVLTVLGTLLTAFGAELTGLGAVLAVLDPLTGFGGTAILPVVVDGYLRRS